MSIVRVTKEHLPNGVIRVTGFFDPAANWPVSKISTQTDAYTNELGPLDWVFISTDDHEGTAMINIEALSALIDALTEIREREDVKSKQIAPEVA